MTTTMSMRERRKKIAALVQNNPRVQACAHRFEAAQADISQWHAHNDVLCATNGALTELEELLTYSEGCIDDLKRAKITAYNQLMSQYPRVWDTTCDDPFNTGTQDSTTDAGAETEEMEEVPTPTTLIRADKLMDIIDREEDAYTATIEWCERWDLDASDVRGRLETVRGIRAQFQRLIDQAKEPNHA